MACRRAANSSPLMIVALAAAGICESQCANHGGQHQALAHECHQNHREHEEQDPIAAREWRAASRGERDRERRGERDDAADPCECQRKGPLPGRRGIAARDRGKEPARKICRGKHPDEAGNDDAADDGGGDGQVVPNNRLMPAINVRACRPVIRNTKPSVSVDQKIPEEYALQPGLGADQLKPFQLI